MPILICTQNTHPVVAKVIELLREKGFDVVIFERYRSDHQITYEYKNGVATANLRVADKYYELTSQVFPSVYRWLKPCINSEVAGGSGSLIEEFCRDEWRVATSALRHFLHDSLWVNDPINSVQTSNKIYQLKLAAEIGLTIPDTVISNNYDRVKSFYDNNNRTIYKTLSSFITPTKAIYTSVLEDTDFLNQDKITIAPGIFQTCLDKDYELRITVVEDNLFILRINSQIHPDMQLDWRKRPDWDFYEAGELSADCREKLLEFHRRADLVYAAYDFVVDKQGREIFLECNPSGQWVAFGLEEKLNLPVSNAIAEALMKGCVSRTAEPPIRSTADQTC